MKITGWKKLFAPHILARGEDYYDTGHVESVQFAAGTVTAEVWGSELYEVEIELAGNRVEGMSCTCPYADDGTPCKHMAAVLYALTAGDFDDEIAEPAQSTAVPDLEKTVAKLSEAALRRFLLDLAKSDEQVAAKLRLLADGYVSERQMKLWLRQIDRLIDRHSDDGCYVDYEHAWDLTESLAAFLDDTVPPLLQAGLVKEAVVIVNTLFVQVAHLEMDDSDGGLYLLFDHCGDCWRAALEKADAAQRRTMYAWFRAQCGNGEPDTFAQEYLRDFLFTAFADPESVKATLAYIDGQLEKANDRYALELLVQNRLTLMKRAGAGKQELERFEDKYLALPEIRRQRIDRLLDGQRYAEAIALLQKSREMDADWPGLVCEYSEALISLYRKLGRQEEYARELHEYLHRFRQDDLTYINALKEITPADAWPDVRERLLALPTLYDLRGDLLVSEGLYRRLMDLASQDSTCRLLDRYEKILVRHFPEEVRDLLAAYLRRAMQEAGNRQQYYTLIRRLKRLKKYPQGQALAFEIAQEWREVYKRRRSLLDELQNAGF